MKKISLSSEQVEQLFLNGECDILDEVYEVSHLSGVYVKIDANGKFVRVDAPEKRPVGRPKKVKEKGVTAPVGRPRRTRIKSKATTGIFTDKVGKFVEGQVVDVESSYPRRVTILKVEVRHAKDITDAEWKDMGCVWTADFAAKIVKELTLMSNGLTMKDEVGLYWYEEIVEE